MGLICSNLDEKIDFSVIFTLILRKNYDFLCSSFSISWEQRKFDSIVTRIGTGLNPRDNFVLNSGGKNYYVTIKNFEHGHLYLDDNCDKVDDNALKIIQARSDLKINDILFTSIGRIGDCYLIKKQPKNWNINESVFALRPNLNEIEPEYLFHVIHSERVLNKVLSDVTGSTFKSIKINDLKKIDIPVTTKVEQITLALFISKIENIITLHQRKQFISDGITNEIFLMQKMTASWEQRKLGEFVDFYSGLTYTPNDVIKDDKGTLVLRSSNVKNGEIVFDDNVYVDSKVVNSSNVTCGDIIVVVRNGSRDLIGKHAEIKENMPKTVIGAFMTGVRSDEPEFMNSLLSTNQFSLEIEKNLGATINQITTGNFAKMQFNIPVQSNEKKRIGYLFLNVDNLITLHQCKCPAYLSTYSVEKYVGYIVKKTITWEQRKLGEVAQITMGQSPDGATYSEKPDKYILVQGNADLDNGWVKPRIWTSQKTKYAVAGDLIMSVRAPAGSMGKTAYNVVLGRGVAAIKGNEFIFQSLVRMDLQGFWKKLSAGSTFESLNSDTIFNAEIKIPRLEEQSAIGSYLESVDNLITLHLRL